MANAVRANGYEEGGGGGARPARLPRWTRQEILVLIQGKKVAESRVGRGRAGSRAHHMVGSAAAAVEPKWAAVSSYCRRHGVERGPVQCRKRWSNLAGDYKKIKDWECRRRRSDGGGEEEEFWSMRNDVRRERRLPGFFDKEVYDILDSGTAAAAPEEEEEVAAAAAAVAVAAASVVVVEEEEEAVFDSGRGAAEDGLFSDFEQEQEEEEERPATATAVTPISEKELPQSHQATSDSGAANEKQTTENPEESTPREGQNPEKESTPREGQKRRRTSPEEDEDTSLQSQLIEVLERNSRMLAAQLEAQNTNCRLDRDQRKDHADSLVGALSKLADALGRIADKL